MLSLSPRFQLHPFSQAHHCKHLAVRMAPQIPIAIFSQDNNLIPKSVEVKHQNISIVVCEHPLATDASDSHFS
jgi:hypothetical protein